MWATSYTVASSMEEDGGEVDFTDHLMGMAVVLGVTLGLVLVVFGGMFVYSRCFPSYSRGGEQLKNVVPPPAGDAGMRLIFKDESLVMDMLRIN